MRIHLRLLRHAEIIQQVLRADGWQVERHQHDLVTARHPLVKDEPAARHRLQVLGLLTASSVHIQFTGSLAFAEQTLEVAGRQ